MHTTVAVEIFEENTTANALTKQQKIIMGIGGFALLCEPP